MEKQEDNLPIKAILLAVFCNILFGSAVPMIKLGYEQFNITDSVFSKLVFAGIRFFLSGIFVLIAEGARVKKFPLMSRGNCLNILLVALTYTFLQYLFNYIGLSNTTGSVASILTATSAFLSMIFAHFLYKNDKMTVLKVVGAVVGFSGILLACLTQGGVSRISFTGEGFVLIAALCFTVGSLLNKRASQRDSSYTVTAYNLIIGGGLLLIIGLIGNRDKITVTLEGALVLLYLIMVSSVGFLLWSQLLRKYPPGKLGVYNFIIPIVGSALSGLMFGDRVFTPQFIVATVLVTVGIILVNLKKKSQINSRE